MKKIYHTLLRSSLWSFKYWWRSNAESSSHLQLKQNNHRQQMSPPVS